MRLIWLVAGLISLALGVIGAFLPLLPTVPFLLLAAICFARSSERLHNWLVTHNVFGPPIADWRENGVIRRRAKFFASLSIASSFIPSFVLEFGGTVLAIQAVALCGVTLFIWSRPEG